MNQPFIHSLSVLHHSTPLAEATRYEKKNHEEESRQPATGAPQYFTQLARARRWHVSRNNGPRGGSRRGRTTLLLHFLHGDVPCRRVSDVKWPRSKTNIQRNGRKLGMGSSPTTCLPKSRVKLSMFRFVSHTRKIEIFLCKTKILDVIWTNNYSSNSLSE